MSEADGVVRLQWIIAIVSGVGAVLAFALAIAFGAAYGWQWGAPTFVGRTPTPMGFGFATLLFLGAVLVFLCVDSIRSGRLYRLRAAQGRRLRLRSLGPFRTPRDSEK